MKTLLIILLLIIFILIIACIFVGVNHVEEKCYIDTSEEYEYDMSKYYSDGEGEEFYDQFNIKKNY